MRLNNVIHRDKNDMKTKTIAQIQSKLNKSKERYTRFSKSEFTPEQWHLSNMRPVKDHFEKLGYGIYAFTSFLDMEKPPQEPFETIGKL